MTKYYKYLHKDGDFFITKGKNPTRIIYIKGRFGFQVNDLIQNLFPPKILEDYYIITQLTLNDVRIELL